MYWSVVKTKQKTKKWRERECIKKKKKKKKKVNGKSQKECSWLFDWDFRQLVVQKMEERIPGQNTTMKHS